MNWPEYAQSLADAFAFIASHMAADWAKTAQRRAFCYTDAALMSALDASLATAGILRCDSSEPRRGMGDTKETP